MIQDGLTKKLWQADCKEIGSRVECWRRHDGKFRVVLLQPHSVNKNRSHEVDGVTCDSEFEAIRVASGLLGIDQEAGK